MKFIALPVSSSKTQFYINQTYVAYVQEAGFSPLLLNPGAEDLDSLIEMCSGLLLPGGADIDPIFYGETNYNSRETDVEKDDFERILLHRFIKAKKPVFGICRGFQLILRELLLAFPETEKAGLSYEQHISNSHNAPGSLNVSRSTPHHEVMAHSFILWGDDTENIYRKRFVNSMHHQGCAIPQKILFKKNDSKTVVICPTVGTVEILAYTQYGAEKDHCIVEAIRTVWDGVELLAVQWHPEELKDVILLKKYFNKYDNTTEHHMTKGA